MLIAFYFAFVHWALSFESASVALNDISRNRLAHISYSLNRNESQPNYWSYRSIYARVKSVEKHNYSLALIILLWKDLILSENIHLFGTNCVVYFRLSCRRVWQSRAHVCYQLLSSHKKGMNSKWSAEHSAHSINTTPYITHNRSDGESLLKIYLRIASII